MHNENDDEQDEGVAAERLRPDEPRGAGEDEDQNVDHHRAVERLELVEDRFDAGVANTRRKVLLQPARIVVERPIESRRVVSRKGGGHRRVSRDGRMQIASRDEAKNAFAHFAPLERVVARRNWRDRIEITGLREKPEALQTLGGDAAVHRDRRG